jgi:hypothetical protein
LRPNCSALILILLVRLPSWSQEATAVGLKGLVHTVRTEEFSDENGESRESRGSTLEVYDRHGYQLEIYRYKPDVSLWVHSIFSRNGERILKTQVAGAVPFDIAKTVWEESSHAAS